MCINKIHIFSQFVFLPAMSLFSFHFLIHWNCNCTHTLVPLFRKSLFLQGFLHWTHGHKKKELECDRFHLWETPSIESNFNEDNVFVPYTMAWSTSYPSNVDIWCAIVHGNTIISYWKNKKNFQMIYDLTYILITISMVWNVKINVQIIFYASYQLQWWSSELECSLSVKCQFHLCLGYLEVQW